MNTYFVMVGGSVIARYSTLAEAEERLEQVKNSWYTMVHPMDTIFIKKVEKNEKKA